MFVERLPKVPHIPEERKYIASAWMGEGGSTVESAMPGSKGICYECWNGSSSGIIANNILHGISSVLLIG